MTCFLRKVRKSKWYNNPDVQWLTSGALQADALSDLQTKGNKLSLWIIEEDSSNLERVVTALGSTCDHAAQIDYALVECSKVKELGIILENTPGDSADEELNGKYHVDATQLTAEQVYNFARLIQSTAEIQRCYKVKLIALLREGVGKGVLKTSSMQPSLLIALSDGKDKTPASS
jgi:hypothetical protein